MVWGVEVDVTVSCVWFTFVGVVDSGVGFAEDAGVDSSRSGGKVNPLFFGAVVDVPEAGGVVENGVAVLGGGREVAGGVFLEDAAVGWGGDDPDEVISV